MEVLNGRLSTTEFSQFILRQDYVSVLAKLLEKSGSRRSIVDDVFYGRGVGKDLEDSWEKIVTGEDANTPWLVEGVLEAGFAKSSICSRDGD